MEGRGLGFNIPAEKGEGTGWFQAHGVFMPELQGDHDEAGMVLMSPGGRLSSVSEKSWSYLQPHVLCSDPGWTASQAQNWGGGSEVRECDGGMELSLALSGAVLKMQFIEGQVAAKPDFSDFALR